MREGVPVKIIGGKKVLIALVGLLLEAGIAFGVLPELEPETKAQIMEITAEIVIALLAGHTASDIVAMLRGLAKPR